MQLKPGRGRSGGPPGGYPSGRPRPLVEPGWGPRPPPPMMRGMGPRPPPYDAPMRGRGAPRGGHPARGRGAPPGAARGWSSTRSRGTRGRGARGGRGATKTTPAKSPANASSIKTKNEKEKDELALSRPWITDALKAEILKKAELQALSLGSKDEKDFEAFKEQRTKVGNMLRAAKMEYIGMQDEQDVEKILADARQKTKEAMTESKAAAKAENGNGATETAPAGATETAPAGATETAPAAANGEAAAETVPAETAAAPAVETST